MKKFIIGGIVSLFFLGIVSFPAFSGPHNFTQIPENESGWHINFLGSIYNSQENTTTFTYEGSADSNADHDISHFVIGYPCVNDTDVDWQVIDTYAEPNGSIEFGLDPTTSVDGVKYDTGISKGSSAILSITYGGITGTAPDSSLATVKGSTDYILVKVPGPVCDNQPTQPKPYTPPPLIPLPTQPKPLDPTLPTKDPNLTKDPTTLDTQIIHQTIDLNTQPTSTDNSGRKKQK